MKITFEAHPIETAPKDREIMCYEPGYGWYTTRWDSVYEMRNHTGWRNLFDSAYPAYPTHWAEIEDMRVREES